MNIFFFLIHSMTIIFAVLLPIQNNRAVSWIAFILCTAFGIAALFFTFIFTKHKTRRIYFTVKKFFEYTPLITVACFVISRSTVQSQTYFMDTLLALIWFIITACTIAALFILSEKRITKKFPETVSSKNFKKNLLLAALDWIDAITQALCIVLLLQIFVFQLYLIPSESMVSKFMIGDRVIGVKFISGPTYPLSSFRLPRLKNYKRGDVVIIRNPNYNDDEKNEIKFFTSQLIQMLTFTTVNNNVDANGKVKADPLVKRIVGCPGEKLMLLDGILYVRKIGESKYSIIDENGYAKWNLKKELTNSEQKYVRDILIDEKAFSVIESIESARKDLDFIQSYNEAKEISKKIKNLKNKKEKGLEIPKIAKNEELLIYSLINNDRQIASKIITTNGGEAWFENFMTKWFEHWGKAGEENTLYEKRFAQFNVLIKLAYGKLILRNIELLSSNPSISEFNEDAERKNLLNELSNYASYLIWAGQRNMNEFPSGKDEYIPENCFFMMGDNRFNSTDMRHGYKIYNTAVDKEDDYSVLYHTNISPKYVHESKILGYAKWIFWPLGRIGKV